MAKQNVPAGKPPKKAARRTPAKKRTYPGTTMMAPVVRSKGIEILDPAATEQFGALGEVTDIGALGLVEIKFTKAEEAILSEPINIDDVRVLPTGQPYLPHPVYTRWFIRAFGRGGWQLKPCAAPAVSHGSIVVPYVLYIHGKPAAFALGEQNYTIGQPSYKQSYGEAVESTVAAGLRRAAKHLGVGLELWDRVWCDEYMHTHAVMVRVQEKGKVEERYRRKVDRPLAGELGGGNGSRTAPAARHEAPARPANVPEELADAPVQGANTPGQPLRVGKGEKITPDQGRRLNTIITNSGRNRDAVKAWLLTRYGYVSTKDVHRQFYDEIIDAIEMRGRLPL
jgi:hypothetical protein